MATQQFPTFQLEACPFCGGVAEQPSEIDEGFNLWSVLCVSCNAEGPPGVSAARASAAWNTRPIGCVDTGRTTTVEVDMSQDDAAGAIVRKTVQVEFTTDGEVWQPLGAARPWKAKGPPKRA